MAGGLLGLACCSDPPPDSAVWGAAPIATGTLAGVLAVSLAATLADWVSGIGLWAFLGETVRVNRPGISDWRPLCGNRRAGHRPVADLCDADGRRHGQRAFEDTARHTAIVLGLGAASVRVNRLDVFFTVSAVNAADSLPGKTPSQTHLHQRGPGPRSWWRPLYRRCSPSAPGGCERISTAPGLTDPDASGEAGGFIAANRLNAGS